MNFKEHVAQDIANVFFNTGEFSDEVEIDNQNKTVNIDENRLMERAAEYGGVTTGMILYYIPVSAFSVKPKVGNSQIFNKKMMYIDDVKEDAGIYEIIISQNRGE